MPIKYSIERKHEYRLQIYKHRMQIRRYYQRL